MSINELTDTEFISRMMIEPHENWTAVQQDLNDLSEQLTLEIKVASSHKQEWNYIRSDQTFLLSTPAAKIITLSQLWHKMERTKQEISHIGVRSTFTKLFYKNMADKSSGRIIEKEIYECLRIIDSQTRQLTALIEEVKTFFQRAENDFRTGPCSAHVEHINALFRQAFETLTLEDKKKFDEKILELQSQLNDQSAEITRLKNEGARPNPNESHPKPENVEPTDDEYFDQMRREVAENDEVPPLMEEESDEENMEIQEEQLNEDENLLDFPLEQRRSPEPDEEGIEEWGLRCRLLEDEMNRVQEAYRNFPYRKKEHRSPGIHPGMMCAFCRVKGEHFSDSCPNFIDGDERYDIILNEGWCRMCLEMCNWEAECPRAQKSCYYCERVRGTPFDYMRHGVEHHTALCNIPNRKEEASLALRRAKEEFEGAFAELERKHKRRRERQEHEEQLRAHEMRRQHAYDGQPFEEHPEKPRGGSDDERRP